jgi:hypothetical protein
MMWKRKSNTPITVPCNTPRQSSDHFPVKLVGCSMLLDYPEWCGSHKERILLVRVYWRILDASSTGHRGAAAPLVQAFKGRGG